ncbi:[FeFe] hydrogenase, group A [Eubacteriales bacterium OttesenSCG-928-G02]|nr:[FeFe] hydrogenase, group A [Eubacteriales bacterium OttesenSCG-928-G02]
MNNVNITIDGIKVTVPSNYTVLEAARYANINIPTLCYLKDVNQIGACRLCLVEVKGGRASQASCVLPVAEGMDIVTNSANLRKQRKINLELILSNHNRECTSCVRSGTCELQTLCNEYGVNDYPYDGENKEAIFDELSPSIVRDNSKCINCRRCIAMCNDIQKIGAIGASKRGIDTTVGCVFDKSLDESPCINCGQCIVACPVGALREKDSIDDVFAALSDPEKFVVVQPAPAVRASLGEEFGMPIGTAVTGKLVAALRRLKFDKIFDTDFAADLTIMEEGTELIGRLTNGGALPMITSCSPGWIKYCETFYPEFIPNLSSCKSPHEMMGAVIKSYFAEKNNIDPKNIYVVSVMPCTAKKFEAKRDELGHNGIQDVDAVLTVRELARMIKNAGIDFKRLKDEEFDDILGESTGAGVIFGATGGVMEAALRTVYEVVTGKTLDNVEFSSVRGTEGIKEAEVDLNGRTVRVAVAHGTGNAKKLLESIKSGEKKYDFIEVMGCPGGCVTGGGQPIINATELSYIDPKALRAKALYGEDAGKAKRKSHENESVKKLYDEFLGEPNSHKAHELLHTHYVPRPKYK